MRKRCLFGVVATVAGVLALCPAASANLLANGDFEAGNTGFSTDYSFAAACGGVGVYSIVTTPKACHLSWGDFPDHTPGTGTKMMVVNGSNDATDVVWSQTVAVAANTIYEFSFWGVDVFGGLPVWGTLQLTANGVPVGLTSNLDSYSTWEKFIYTWMSPASPGSVTLRLFDINTSSGGNDFGLDDLSFVAVGTIVPEPAATLLFGAALLAAGWRRRAGSG